MVRDVVAAILASSFGLSCVDANNPPLDAFPPTRTVDLFASVD